MELIQCSGDDVQTWRDSIFGGIPPWVSKRCGGADTKWHDSTKPRNKADPNAPSFHQELTCRLMPATALKGCVVGAVHLLPPLAAPGAPSSAPVDACLLWRPSSTKGLSLRRDRISCPAANANVSLALFLWLILRRPGTMLAGNMLKDSSCSSAGSAAGMAPPRSSGGDQSMLISQHYDCANHCPGTSFTALITAPEARFHRDVTEHCWRSTAAAECV